MMKMSILHLQDPCTKQKVEFTSEMDTLTGKFWRHCLEGYFTLFAYFLPLPPQATTINIFSSDDLLRVTRLQNKPNKLSNSMQEDKIRDALKL